MRESSMRQHEAAVMQARRSYAAWRVSRDFVEVERIRERLEFAQERARLRPENVQLLAQAIFVATLSAEPAVRMVKSAMFDDAVAHLNLAFLLAWQGSFSQARRAYRSASKKKPNADVLSQVFTFFEWLSNHSPDHAYVCNWCEAVIRSETQMEPEIALRMFSLLARMTDHFPPDEIEKIGAQILDQTSLEGKQGSDSTFSSRPA